MSYLLNTLQTPSRQTPLNTRTFFVSSTWCKYGICQRSPSPAKNKSIMLMFKNVQSFLIFLKNRGYFYQGCKKHISKVIFCRREKTTDAHRRKFILPFIIAILQRGKWHFKTNPYYHIPKENH